jgi:hypothetical protein
MTHHSHQLTSMRMNVGSKELVPRSGEATSASPSQRQPSSSTRNHPPVNHFNDFLRRAAHHTLMTNLTSSRHISSGDPSGAHPLPQVTRPISNSDTTSSLTRRGHFPLQHDTGNAFTPLIQPSQRPAEKPRVLQSPPHFCGTRKIMAPYKKRVSSNIYAAWVTCHIHLESCRIGLAGP